MTTYTRRQIGLGAAALAAGSVLPARAAGWPERDILFVNPWSSAGSVDAMVRQYTKQLEKLIPGANFTIQSMPGASGTIGVGTTVRAKPDGYTIGFAGNITLVYQPMAMKGLAWSKADDVHLICKLGAQPTMLLVKYDSPIRNLDDFMKQALSRPVSVAIAGRRTSSDMELQQMNMTARTQIRTIPFSGGTAETVLALLSGRVDAFTSYGEAVRGHIDAKAMRAIAVFQKDRYFAFPDVTPLYDVPALRNVRLLPSESYVIAPKGVPKDILDKLGSASRTVITSDEYQAFARRAGLVVEHRTPEEMLADLARVQVVFKEMIQKLDGKT